MVDRGYRIVHSFHQMFLPVMSTLYLKMSSLLPNSSFSCIFLYFIKVINITVFNFLDGWIKCPSTGLTFLQWVPNILNWSREKAPHHGKQKLTHLQKSIRVCLRTKAKAKAINLLTHCRFRKQFSRKKGNFWIAKKYKMTRLLQISLLLKKWLNNSKAKYHKWWVGKL